MRRLAVVVAGLYSLLLRLYPRPFRSRFGPQMAEVFRERSLQIAAPPAISDGAVRSARSRAGRLLRFWLEAFTDLLRTAGAERREASRRHGSGSPRPVAAIPATPVGREGRPMVVLADLVHDLRQALRQVVRRPAFTVVIALTLGLGIGANTAVFSVVNSVLLNPLPYDSANRMFLVWKLYPDSGLSTGLSYPEMQELRRRSRTLERIEILDSRDGQVGDGSETTPVRVGVASPGLFEALELTPRLGRGLVEADAAAEAEQVVLLDEAFWHRSFGAAPEVLGRVLTVDGGPAVVVGVVDASVRYLPGARNVGLWVPMRQPPDPGGWLNVLAWRRPDVSVERARAEMEVLAFEDEPDGRTTQARLVLPGDTVADETRALLYGTLAAVSLVLLIACVNVAHLMLARRSTRRHEIAVRAALGAGRSRLVRELLTESGLMVLAGGALGALLAVWGVDLLAAMRPDSLRIALEDVRIDATVIAYAAGVSMVAGALSGLAPILDVSRLQPGQAMRRAGSATVAAGGGMLRQGLLVAEVALSTMLLVGAGLLVHGLVRLRGADPGYDPERLVSAPLNVDLERFPETAQRTELYVRALEVALDTPGVETATLAYPPPVHDMFFGGTLRIEDTGAVHERVLASLTWTAPGYFRALGIPILEGRDFVDSDAGAPDSPVIVNRTFAERFLGGGAAVGQRFRRLRGEIATTYRIVGVVGDAVQYDPLEQEYDLQVYFPLWTQTFNLAPGGPATGPTRLGSLVMRLAPEAPSPLGPLRERLRALDPDLEMSREVDSIRDRLSGALEGPRFNAMLFGAFALVALGLASIGLYGVVSHTVERRAREMGIRVAVGARAADVRRLVLRQGMAPVGVGIVAGLAGAVAAGRIIAGLLYLVEPLDPLVFTLVPCALVLVAAAAIWFPALRATRVDPVAVMRAE